MKMFNSVKIKQDGNKLFLSKYLRLMKYLWVQVLNIFITVQLFLTLWSYRHRCNRMFVSDMAFTLLRSFFIFVT